jgi:hypothetical protein
MKAFFLSLGILSAFLFHEVLSEIAAPHDSQTKVSVVLKSGEWIPGTLVAQNPSTIRVKDQFGALREIHAVDIAKAYGANGDALALPHSPKYLAAAEIRSLKN